MAGNIYDTALEALDDEQQLGPPAPNPFEDTLTLQDTAGKQRLRGAMTQAAETSPDRAAEVRRLSARTGVAPEIVERDFDTFSKRGQVDDVPYGPLQEETPALAAWLEKPENAKLAADDIAPLHTLAKTLQHPHAHTAERLFAAVRSLSAGLNEGIAGLFGALEVGATANAGFQRPPGVRGAWRDSGPGAAAFHQGMRKAMSEIAEVARPNLDGASMLERGIYSGIESVGMMAPGFAASMATGSPAPMLSLLGTSTLGLSYGKASDKGVGHARALAFGALDAAIEVATEFIPAKWFFADLAKQTGLITLIKRQLGAEVPGELVATTLQSLNEFATLRPDEPIQTYLDELPSALAETVIATITMVGVMGAAGKVMSNLARDGARTKQAERDQEFFKALASGVKGSATVERLPAAAQALVAELTKDGPIERVYAPIETFATYWQDKGLDTPHGRVEGAEAVAGELTGDPEAFARSVRTGEDLSMPTASYAVQLAGTDHHAFFAEELRLGSPDRMNAREFAAFKEAEAAKADAPPAAPAEPSPLRQEILQKIQAAVAGTKIKLPKGAVEGYADIFEALTTTFEREGLDPVETLKRYGLLVVGPQEEAASAVPVVPFTERLKTAALNASIEKARASIAAQAKANQAAPAVRLETPAQGAPQPAGAPIAGEAPDVATRNAAMQAEAAAAGPAYLDPTAIAAGRALAARLALDKATPPAETEPSDAAAEPEPSRLADPGRQLARERIPASDPGTGKKAGERADKHLTRVFDAILGAARALDPAVDPIALRAEFDYRLELLFDRQTLAAEGGHDRLDLLRAIARMGGIAIGEQTGGELRELKGKFGSVRGVPGIPGVFRNKKVITKAVQGKGGGLGLDVVFEQLKRDPRFAFLESESHLTDEIDEITRHGADGPSATELPGTEELRDVSIKTEKAWWRDAWLAPAEVEIDESATEGDDSFDVSTLDQVATLFQDAPEEPRATYVGEQDDGQGGRVSLFNIVGGPQHKSTVTEETLLALGIAVPAKELEPALPGLEAIGGTAAALADLPFRLTAEIAATPAAKRMQRTLFQDPIDLEESAGATQEQLDGLHQLRSAGVTPTPSRTKAELQAAGFDTTVVLYHQTATVNVEAIKAEGFDLTKGKARLSDEQVPDGVFFKPTQQDIGVGGQPGEVTQIPVYLRMGEVRTFTNRDDLEATLSADEEYRTLVQEARDYDREQSFEFDSRWEQIRQRDVKGETYAAAKLEADIDNFLVEWKKGNNDRAAYARARATEIFEAEGVETVIIQKDQGSGNRSTRTVIAIAGNQVALAEPGNERILFQPFYHGSPHEFDRFSAEKIGTGEGAQTFRWGLYFAENPKVAKEYQKRLPDASSPYRFTVNGQALDDNTPERHAASLLFFGELQEVRRTTKRWIKEAAEPDALGMADTAKQAGLSSADYWQRLADFAATHSKRDIKGAQGSLYQVDIPDAAVDKMLDRDAPLSEQPEPVKALVRARLKELKYLTPTDDGPRVLTHAMAAYANEHGGFSEPIGTGGMAYDMLVKAETEKAGAEDAEKRVSLTLAAAGVPGLKYFDEGSRAKKRGTRNVVVFDDTIVTVTHKDGTPVTPAERQEFLQVDPPSPPTGQPVTKRGAITGDFDRNAFFGPDLKFNIQLFEKADATTFLHESAHLFLKIMEDLSTRPEATPQLTADMATLRAWFGTQEIGTAQHERFANGFVKYVSEGKAPSLGLRELFGRFRQWLMRFKAELDAHQVELTDDVRAVFDRMLATDTAITEAQAAVQATPMFTTPESARMSAEEFDVYQGKIAEAGRVARETLEGKLLRDLQRQQRASYREEKQALREQVEAEVYALPVYQALAAMRKGTHPDGTPLVEGVPLEPLKLSRQIIVDRYGPERLAALPTYPPPIHTATGGMDPDTVAELFGFASGDALLTAVAEAVPMRGLIEAETTKRMTAQAGDLMVDNKLSDLAKAAVANEHREAIVRIEMQTLGRLKRTAQASAVKERDYERRWFEAEAKLRIAIAEGRKGLEIEALTTEVQSLKAQARGGAARINAALPTEAELREVARARIGRTRVRDLKPDLFHTAARRAGQQAIEAAARQDFDSAIAAKQQEAISLALFREATRAVEDIEARVKAAVALDTPASRKRIGLAGGGFQEQIDGILDRYQFARISGKALTKREALRQWISQLEADGFSVDLPDDVVDDARRIHFRELPVDELVAVSDTLKSIVHLARLKNRLLKNKDARDFAIERDKLVTSIRAHNDATPVPLEFRPSDDRRRTIREWFASHARIGTLAQVMDGADGGAMWSAIVRPINTATDAKQSRNEAEGLTYAQIMQRHYPGRELGRWHEQKDVAGVGSLSKEARLSVALNWGNQTSRDRLLNDPRRKWNARQIAAILDTLDERDWQFVVDTWRFLDRFWPEIAAKTKRLTGVEPERVEGIPVATKFGTFAGGYYPLAYDARMNIKSQQHEAATEAKLKTSAAYVRTTTRRGHLEARQSHVKLSVRLDLGVMFSHLEQVIHDLTHHEALIDVTRLLRDPAVSNAILETKGDVIYQQFTRALESIAAGKLDPAKNGMEKAATFARTGTQIALLGFNLWTGIQQPLGLFNGAEKVGVKWVARGLGRWLKDAVTMERTTVWIDSVSPFMATRTSSATQDLADLRTQLRTSGGWWDTVIRTVTLDLLTQQHLLDSFLWHIGMMQRVADVPTWLGQYEKSTAAGEPEARAISLADQAVIDSQGSGRLSDLSQVQRGGPIARLFLTFYSYGSATYNATYRRAGQTDFKSPAQVTAFLGALSLIYIFPSMATVALSRMVGRSGGDDDEEWLPAYMQDVGRETLSAALNGMVWIRELSQIASEGTRGYAGPAGARALQLMYQLAGQAKQGELDEALLKAINQVGGVLFRYPAAQVQRTIDGWAALQEDETDNPAALLFGPPRE